ncbi:transposase [Streptomyces sp. SKN60]|uniref:transposase n=1 Tax=Streptomyces sp. SKN60 TaxID=2855506 RepID=UPI002245EF96|nr:transposase [Streptomyces sp. SKN60]MCX2185694.1 transposase [Streptomyces sp. SKN60]
MRQSRQLGPDPWPPRGRTWARLGDRPTVRGRGGGHGRVDITGVCCCGPGQRSHFFYKLHVYRGRRNGPKTFSRTDCSDLITATHQQLGTPIVWCWDNLSVHLRQEPVAYAQENKAWLRVYQLPSYAPDLNPTEGVWSLPKRSIANFVAADLRSFTRMMKRKFKKLQYRPELINNCLAQTGSLFQL